MAGCEIDISWTNDGYCHCTDCSDENVVTCEKFQTFGGYHYRSHCINGVAQIEGGGSRDGFPFTIMSLIMLGYLTNLLDISCVCVCVYICIHFANSHKQVSVTIHIRKKNKKKNTD